MKKCILLALLLMIFANFVSAQNIVDNRGLGGMFVRLNKSADIKDYENTKGSPYSQESFVKANLDGTEETYLVRYDAYKGLLQFKGKDGQIQTLSPNNLYRLNLINSKQAYVVTTYPDNQQGFGLLLWETKDGSRLIRREAVRYNPAQEAKDSYSKDKPASFGKIKYSYYLQKKKDGKIVRLPSQKERILQLLGEEAAKVAKREDLNPKNEADLIKLLGLLF